MSNKLDSNFWEKFVYDFDQVNSYYRRGLFEIIINPKAPNEYKELKTNPTKEKDSLLNFVNRIYQFSFKAWQDNKIPQNLLPKVLKILVFSFEIDEYFQVISKKRIFFRDFVNNFLLLHSDETIEENFRNKCNEVYENTLPPYSTEKQKENFIKIADEILLLCLCGINVYYSASSETSPQEGLQRTEQIIKYIDFLSNYKSKNLTEEPISLRNRGLGLKGLANYFKGRFLYSLGRYNDAEAAFEESKSNYLEKMFWKTASTEKADAEARALSLRRASLAQILGSARIYLRQSRLSEALEILEKVRPFLPLATGKVMSRIADLTYVSAKRIKFSSDYEILVGCKKLAEECYEDFKQYIPDSYYVHRCYIEISLINFFLKNFVSPITAKIELLDESFRKLDVVIDYYQQSTQMRLSKNRRLLIEALTTRSHIRRNIPYIDQTNHLKNINLAINDAQKAVELAGGMKQLECSAYIALGVAYREKFSLSENILKSNFSEKNNDFFVKKQEVADYFFKALFLNNDENPRVTVLSYLWLSEIELLHQPNYVLATFYFEKFKKYEHQIQHQYILEFAAELERKLSERRVPDFYVNTSNHLSYKKWSDELKEYLIKNTIYQTAIEIHGIMPAKRRRREEPISSRTTVVDKNTRQTRQSLLAGAFKEKMELAQKDAFDTADKYLSEFENICNIISRQQSKDFNNNSE